MNHEEISGYLRMMNDANNINSPTCRAAYADALVAVLRDIFPDNELQEVAKAKLEGRLIVLPCKIGDKVFFPDHYNKKVASRRITGIRQNTSGAWQAIGGCLCFPFSEFGNRVFLSAEEAAQKALQEAGDE